jgi:hypothetical protein
MRKIILIIVLFIAAFTQVNAQMNYISKGNKLIYFGIAMGVNMADYTIVRKPKLNAQNTDSIKLVSTRFGPGFDLGIITNLQFHKYMDLRFVPSLSFSDKQITFMEEGNPNPVPKKVSSIYLSFPLTFRYKSKPIKDFRFFVLGGLRYNFDLNALSNARNNGDQILVNQHDFGGEMGFGFQVFFPTFVFSPEIKVFHSFMDIKRPNEDLIYSRAIDKLFSRIFTFTFNLEG